MLLITAFSLPDQFPLARWVYYWVPGMDLFRSVSYASVFAKPFAVLTVAVVLADASLLQAEGRRALLLWAAAIMLTACVIQAIHIEPFFYWDSLDYGWIAIGGSLALALSLALLPERNWKRWGSVVLCLVLAGEVVVHRVAFEAKFYAALAALRPQTTEASAAAEFSIDSWYERPRRLVYQPVRVPVPRLVAPYEPVGDIYHYIWSFVGIDPCVPGTRSDTYARWVAEALRRRGATEGALNYGMLGQLGGDFNAAFGCGQPKLTISDPKGTAQVVRFSANDVSIAVSAPAGGILTYRDAWLPAWQATIDGTPEPVERNGDGFKTLRIPPGDHRVEFVFRPLMGEGAMTALALLLSVSVVVQLWLAWGARAAPREDAHLAAAARR